MRLPRIEPDPENDRAHHRASIPTTRVDLQYHLSCVASILCGERRLLLPVLLAAVEVGPSGGLVAFHESDRGAVPAPTTFGAVSYPAAQVRVEL